MREVGALQAKNELGHLLELVEQGEEIVITREGRPVARLARAPGVRDPAAAMAAAERIIANRTGRSLGGLTIKDLIEEGRP